MTIEEVREVSFCMVQKTEYFLMPIDKYYPKEGNSSLVDNHSINIEFKTKDFNKIRVLKMLLCGDVEVTIKERKKSK